jgi:hypothetical protein
VGGLMVFRKIRETVMDRLLKVVGGEVKQSAICAGQIAEQPKILGRSAIEKREFFSYLIRQQLVLRHADASLSPRQAWRPPSRDI